MLLGEVLAPAIPALGVQLVALLTFLVALALCLLAQRLMQGVAHLVARIVGGIPFVGSAVEHAVTGGAEALTGYMGDAVSGLDRAIAGYWAGIGIEWHWMAAELEAGANALHTLATVALGSRTVRVIEHGAGVTRRQLGAVAAKVEAADRRIARLAGLVEHPERVHVGAALGKALHPIEGRLRGVERWTYPKIRAAEYEIGSVIEPDLAALRQRVAALEDSYLSLYRDASGVLHATDVQALAAAVALALPSLGLQFLRCGNVGAVGRAVCGLGSDLVEALLGGAIEAFAVADICEFAAGIEDVALAIEPALYGLVDVTEALVGCHGTDAPGPLDVPALPTLASGPGLPLAA